MPLNVESRAWPPGFLEKWCRIFFIREGADRKAIRDHFTGCRGSVKRSLDLKKESVNDPKIKKSATESERPAEVPNDYKPIVLLPKNGPPILLWGRVVETRTPDGLKKLTIDGIIPQ